MKDWHCVLLSCAVDAAPSGSGLIDSEDEEELELLGRDSSGMDFGSTIKCTRVLCGGVFQFGIFFLHLGFISATALQCSFRDGYEKNGAVTS